VEDHKQKCKSEKQESENNREVEWKKKVKIERLTPLTEFNTLYNCLKEIRGSIQLKESNVA